MRLYKWRTSPTGSEGTACIYVDSYTGSDTFGNGTRTNPYASLTKATSLSGVNLIICRGSFSETINTTNSAKINGDYLGAATFDGNDVYEFNYHIPTNMIIKNVRYRKDGETELGNGIYPGSNYQMNNSVIISSPFNSGALCGQNSSSALRIVYAGLKSNSSYKVKFKIDHFGWYFSSVTFYALRITNFSKSANNSGSVNQSLFVDWDMVANVGITYTSCMFAADCKWYYLVGNNTSSAYYELTISGSTSAERQASLLAALEAKYIELGVAVGSRVYPTFNSCVFSAETTNNVFNNAAAHDYTLKPTSDAVTCFTGVTEKYVGALPPAINIPIMANSNGNNGTWDEHTISGCLEISAQNKICVDTDSASTVGQILSKVVSINPLQVQLNGVFADFASRFATYGVYANKDSIFAANQYSAGETLPTGRYFMTGLSVYQDEVIDAGQIIVVTAANTSFTSSVAGCKAIEINEPNVMEVVYCRCRNAIYATVGTSDTLQEGATYLNNSGMNITYHNRTIANGESFVCMIDGEQFTCQDATKRIAVMFDDTRVPSVEWCPAQLFGEYFVAKNNGSIVTDAYGIPLSSGNYMAYQSGTLMKSVMDRLYIQFMFKVNKDATGVTTVDVSPS